MPLYTLVLTVDLGDDTEAAELLDHLTDYSIFEAEVVDRRWHRDLDAEAAATLAGVTWGGR